MAKKPIGVCLLFAAGLAAAAGDLTEAQLKAQYYFDLGPDEIDVSAYPKEQQAAYAAFRKACSQCHTLARPINSPWVKGIDWQRYILRMHRRTESRPGTVITKQDAKALVDFLVYDAQIRKIRGRKEFDARTAELKVLFEEVKAERAKRARKADDGKLQPAAPYTGTKP